MSILNWFHRQVTEVRETPEQMVRRVWTNGEQRERERRRKIWIEWQETRSRTHAAYCDTNMPTANHWAMEGVPVKCNCDGSDPATNNLLAALAELNQADAAMQHALFGKAVLPPVTHGTDFESVEHDASS